MKFESHRWYTHCFYFGPLFLLKTGWKNSSLHGSVVHSHYLVLENLLDAIQCSAGTRHLVQPNSSFGIARINGRQQLRQQSRLDTSEDLKLTADHVNWLLQNWFYLNEQKHRSKFIEVTHQPIVVDDRPNFSCIEQAKQGNHNQFANHIRTTNLADRWFYLLTIRADFCRISAVEYPSDRIGINPYFLFNRFFSLHHQ